MSERIHEVVLITRNTDGSPHVDPMELGRRGSRWLLTPRHPSRTLANLQRTGFASASTTDDVRVYAGCLGGGFDWPLTRCERIDGYRLSDALSHRELQVERYRGDTQRPELLCRELAEFNHRPFQGFNRAQAAVLELASLIRRLHRLPEEKIADEIAYLRIAIEKTAGSDELQAWACLIAQVDAYRARHCA